MANSNDVNVQLIVNAINDAVGSYGTTIDLVSKLQNKAGIDAEFAKLVEEMNAGSVGAVLLYDVNPAYDYFDAEKFIAGLKKFVYRYPSTKRWMKQPNTVNMFYQQIITWRAGEMQNKKLVISACCSQLSRLCSRQGSGRIIC